MRQVNQASVRQVLGPETRRLALSSRRWRSAPSTRSPAASSDSTVQPGSGTAPLGLILITAILGQLISNTATALVVIPIALSAAAAFGVSGRRMLTAVNAMSAAAFLTPVATPGNMMVMGPGGYQFNDYWKLGLPMLLWFADIALVWVPLIWRF